MEIVQKEGQRNVKRMQEFYSLDAIRNCAKINLHFQTMNLLLSGFDYIIPAS